MVEVFANLSNKVRNLLNLSREVDSDQWKAFASDETLGSLAARLESGVHRVRPYFPYPKSGSVIQARCWWV